MDKKFKVLYAVAECGKYGKTGGMGEVAEVLPKNLAANGLDILRVMPFYSINTASMKYIVDFPVLMGNRYQTCTVKYNPDEKGVTTYFICNDWYFNRENIYGYFDDGERFLFFCKSVMEMVKRLDIKPDIIHCNDWHTGMIPLLVKSGDYDIKTVFTIHNLKYHGCITAEYLGEQSIKQDELNKLGYPEGLDFMKAALIHSDYLTTVSPGYAREILTSSMGEGMDGLLQDRKDRLRGILNGMDTDTYNPEKIGDLYYPYGISTIKEKEKNKECLKKELGLKGGSLPLVCAITRLDEQKGIEIIIEAVSRMKMNGFQFVIMGGGNMYYQKLLSELSDRYKEDMVVCSDYEPSLARKIYGGSDIFIMPSRYEPGGLGQQYAMAYGTVPVVRRTGGLKDTVIDIKDDKVNGNGFCFDEFTVISFIKALRRAFKAYRTPMWEKLVRNGMNTDKSWNKPAQEYIDIYMKLIK